MPLRTSCCQESAGRQWSYSAPGRRIFMHTPDPVCQIWTMRKRTTHPSFGCALQSFTMFRQTTCQTLPLTPSEHKRKPGYKAQNCGSPWFCFYALTMCFWRELYGCNRVCLSAVCLKNTVYTMVFWPQNGLYPPPSGYREKSHRTDTIRFDGIIYILCTQKISEISYTKRPINSTFPKNLLTRVDYWAKALHQKKPKHGKYVLRWSDAGGQYPVTEVEACAIATCPLPGRSQLLLVEALRFRGLFQAIAGWHFLGQTAHWLIKPHWVSARISAHPLRLPHRPQSHGLMSVLYPV